MLTRGSRIRVVATAVTVLAALFWWLGFAVVIAQQPPPHVFVGIAAVDGKPMADGRPITAWINGDMVGRSVVDGGTYILLVVEPADHSFEGEKIRFKIGGLKAQQVAYWEQGGGTELHLTATASGPKGGNLTPVLEGSPGHTAVDCAQKVQPACQNNDGGQNGDGQNGDGTFQDGNLVIRKADVRRTAVGGELTLDVRRIALTPIQIDQTVRRLKTQARRQQQRLEQNGSTQQGYFDRQNLLRLKEINDQRAEQKEQPKTVRDRVGQESDRQETRPETRRLELQSQQELEQQRIRQGRKLAAREAQFDLERQRAGREAQLDLERQSLEPEYPELGVFRIKGRTDEDRKPAGSVPRRKNPSGRGFFTNSANGAIGGFNDMLDPTILAVIGILLTLVATSTSLFKGD